MGAYTAFHHGGVKKAFKIENTLESVQDQDGCVTWSLQQRRDLHDRVLNVDLKQGKRFFCSNRLHHSPTSS